MIPLPFSRGLFLWGRPIEVPADAGTPEMEAARQRLQDELNRITAEADAAVTER